eukprot:GHRQ01034366.1.p1 GENE.GHRQ01034366.1~~GHRQ01034366.1.p1  ORF type:complete len:111 (+),score=28.54 GHRQ01034366.1:347-679(+)
MFVAGEQAAHMCMLLPPKKPATQAPAEICAHNKNGVGALPFNNCRATPTLKASRWMTPCAMLAATSRSTAIMAMLVLPAPVGAHTSRFSLLQQGESMHSTRQPPVSRQGP